MLQFLDGEPVIKIDGLGVNLTRNKSKLQINTLELMAALYGLRLLCDSVKNSRILLQLDNTCAVADINKMGSTQSSDIMLYTRYSAVVDDHVVHEI